MIAQEMGALIVLAQFQISKCTFEKQVVVRPQATRQAPMCGPKLWFSTIKPRQNPCGFKAIRNCGAKPRHNIIKGAQARDQSCVVYLCQGENTYDFLIHSRQIYIRWSTLKIEMVEQNQCLCCMEPKTYRWTQIFPCRSLRIG